MFHNTESASVEHSHSQKIKERLELAIDATNRLKASASCIADRLYGQEPESPTPGLKATHIVGNMLAVNNLLNDLEEALASLDYQINRLSGL